jgi:HAD superfamily hydrolase (TIGR01549 family)
MNLDQPPRPLRAILFDLDGTLLDVSMDEFLPRYFEALAASVAHLVPPDRFMPVLMQASEAMMANDGRETNAEVFAHFFYPRIGCPREELEPVFEIFYAEIYPGLQRFTRRLPEARQAVQLAFDRGYDVVIATNPLFPATAIVQRLEWADVADFPFRLVTAFENSRATKPNPLYFAQILETIGHPATDCLMVGDEEMDMVAGHLGCPTFLVTGTDTAREPTIPEPTRRGTLADLIAWMKDDL